MKSGRKAPIEYVIGVVRFPPVANLEKFAGAIQEALRDEYPLSKNPKISEYGIKISEKGVEVSNQEVSLWQFMNSDGDSGVIVNQGLVGLHTIAYKDHEDFLAKLLKVVDVARNVEGNHLRFIEAMALRYVDLIVPEDGKTLPEYMHHKLPSDIGIDGLSMNEGVNVLGMKSPVGELRLQVFLNPKTVIPTDLVSPLLTENGWVWDLPDGDFVTIDTDHATIYKPPREIETIDVRDHMFSLRKPIGDIFKRIATPFAMEAWGLKQ